MNRDATARWASRGAAIVVAAMLAAGCGPARPRVATGLIPPHLTHGVAVGEVTATSAIVWGRCDRPTTLSVALDADAAPRVVEVAASHDFTGKVVLENLRAGTSYRYRAWCGAAVARAATGTFRTAPEPTAAAPVRILWGGDVGGQNVCRDAVLGYPIFERMRARRADLFVALGDMIYADDACARVGRFGNRQVEGPAPAGACVATFRAHWRHHRADPHAQRFFAETPYYAVWDDHEIHNDAGPANATLPSEPNAPRLAPARAAFLEWQPLVDGERLYRFVRWGRHVEIFFLDTRSQRDANGTPDTGREPKTMLGEAQRRWLVDGLLGSRATWKVIVSSVPLSVPTGGDGWADAGSGVGFERELVAILAAMQAANVRNSVWLTTDIHFATGFRSTPFPGYHLLDLASGPLSAGFFLREDLDPTLRPERLYLYGPTERPGSFKDARRYFNFGELEVDAAGDLVARIVNGEGAVVFERRFAPES